MTQYLGMDLAWGPRARTGLAALDDRGRLVASCSVRTDEEIVAFVAAHAAGELVAAIDAPLVVPNETGRRHCEALVSGEFGAYSAGAYPSNRSNPLFNPPRGARLATRLGWDMDPATPPCSGKSVAIEVYPHPAMITLFGLATVLPYKARSGRDLESRRAAFVLLCDHLERVCGATLWFSESTRWSALRQVVRAAERKSELRSVEDEIAAVLCAYVAWLWATAAPRPRVLGNFATGYIVVPGAPSVPPLRRTQHAPRGVPPRH